MILLCYYDNDKNNEPPKYKNNYQKKQIQNSSNENKNFDCYRKKGNNQNFMINIDKNKNINDLP